MQIINKKQKEDRTNEKALRDAGIAWLRGDWPLIMTFMIGSHFCNCKDSSKDAIVEELV